MSSPMFKIWLDAIRPRTLLLALACIVTGNALAFEQSRFSITLFVLALITALLLQILSNLANDYGDAIKGTDNDNRIGPKRTIQQGLISPKSMKQAILFNIVLAVIVGGLLIFYAFDSFNNMISFTLLGFFAILAAVGYTVGNKPYGYLGLGDLSVLVFFGWLGVLGSYYLQAGKIEWDLFLPATASGLLAVGVLNINNLRDIENDKLSKKLTLIVRIGETKGKIYHLILLSLSFILFATFNFISNASISYWLFLFALPLAFTHGKAVWFAQNGEQIRPMMADIVKLTIITNLLFALPFFIISVAQI